VCCRFEQRWQHIIIFHVVLKDPRSLDHSSTVIYKDHIPVTGIVKIFEFGNYVKLYTRYVFHYNDQIAKDISADFSQNPLEQLENEVLYIKRMFERGMGAKEYYPFTKIQ